MLTSRNSLYLLRQQELRLVANFSLVVALISFASTLVKGWFLPELSGWVTLLPGAVLLIYSLYLRQFGRPLHGQWPERILAMALVVASACELWVGGRLTALVFWVPLSFCLAFRCQGLVLALIGYSGLVLVAVDDVGSHDWSFWATYVVVVSLALVVGWKNYGIETRSSESLSAYPNTKLYNAQRLEVDLGREINRADRGQTGLVILILSAAGSISTVVAGNRERDREWRRFGQALSRTLPAHCSGYQVSKHHFVVLMPVSTVDDVVLLKADLSDALGRLPVTINSLPIVYVPQYRSRSDGEAEAAAERIHSVMDVINRLAL